MKEEASSCCSLHMQALITCNGGDDAPSGITHLLEVQSQKRTQILQSVLLLIVLLEFCFSRVVINYDFPTGVEDYVHRIGRTGRASATGVAHTFFGDRDAKYAFDLIKVLEEANQKVPPEIRDMASHGGGMSRFRRWGSGAGGPDGGRGGRYESSYGGSSSYSSRPEITGGSYDSGTRARADRGSYSSLIWILAG